MAHSSHPIIRRFIEDAGGLSQAAGFGRVAGQLYAYLYFSSAPRTLDDMKEDLGISKGSASMCVRQLEGLGAVQRVWVKGDRKDYYAANDYFGQIIRSALREVAGRRVEAFGRMLDEAEAQLANGNGSQKHNGLDRVFLKNRIQRLRAFQKKAARLWNSPLVQMMLK
jgi:DNA-binding transcriptional regulator GbsR (MarR family)